MPQYPTLRAQISATITQHPPEKQNKTDRAHGSQLGPARMIAESLTSKPGIREHYRHFSVLGRCTALSPQMGPKVDIDQVAVTNRGLIVGFA